MVKFSSGTGSLEEFPFVGDQEIYLIKAQADGTMIWQKEFGSLNSNFFPTTVVELVPSSNGGVIVHYVQSNFDSAEDDILKLDANGQEEFHVMATACCFRHLNGVVETANGQVVYNVTSAQPFPTYSRIYQLDQSGNIAWTTVLNEVIYGAQIPPDGTFVANNELLAMPDNGVILAGNTSSPLFNDPNSHLYLIKLDAAGDVVWANLNYDFSAFTTFMSSASDGGFLLAGEKDDQVWFMKTDDQGNIALPCTNLLSNPGFENGLNGWSITGNVTITTDAFSGNKAAEACGSPASISQIYPATVGQEYTGSVWGKGSLDPSNPVAPTIVLRFLRADYSPIGSSFPPIPQSATVFDPDYTLKNVTAVHHQMQPLPICSSGKREEVVSP